MHPFYNAPPARPLRDFRQARWRWTGRPPPAAHRSQLLRLPRLHRRPAALDATRLTVVVDGRRRPHEPAPVDVRQQRFARAAKLAPHRLFGELKQRQHCDRQPLLAAPLQPRLLETETGSPTPILRCNAAHETAALQLPALRIELRVSAGVQNALESLHDRELPRAGLVRIDDARLRHGRWPIVLELLCKARIVVEKIFFVVVHGGSETGWQARRRATRGRLCPAGPKP